MRTIVPNERTQSTPLEMMSSCKAAMLILFTSAFITISAILSFLPQNTNYTVKGARPKHYPSKTASNRAQFSAEPLNSFNILSVIPSLSEPVKELKVNITGIARLYDNQMRQVSSRDINISKVVSCQKFQCDEAIVETYNFVDYKSALVVVDVSADRPVLKRALITSTSLNAQISIIFFVLISAMTFVVVFVLVFIVPKRLYPTRPDHWSTLVLGLAALCIDGPWLILKYYSSKWFSNIYDIMPELFHIVFVLFVMSFFNSLTHGIINRVLGSWTLSLFIAAGLISVIVLESVATNYLPLNAGSIFLGESALQIPIVVLSVIMHLIIIGIIVLGIINVQIPDDATLVLTSLNIMLVEVLDVIRVGLRFWCPRKRIGFSFAADVFYILVANYVTAFFLTFNLPVALAIDVEKKEEMKENLIVDTNDAVNLEDLQSNKDVEQGEINPENSVNVENE